MAANYPTESNINLNQNYPQGIMPPNMQRNPNMPMNYPPGYMGQEMQNMMNAPGCTMYGNFFAFSIDPMKDLALAKSASIKQAIEWLEVITGCETRNRYDVFLKDEFGVKKYAFKCKEQSGCCARCICAGDSRPFKMKVQHVNQNSYGESFKQLFAWFDRPFRCTCCCLRRPEMFGKYEKTQSSFGHVKENWSCCSPMFTVTDKMGNPKYYVEIKCCQCGWCCSCCNCGLCNEIDAIIYDYNGRNPVGKITKKIAFWKELISKANNWGIQFPAKATPEEKLLLIGCVLFIDYRYFEPETEQDKE